jgi:hypothetical protein
MEAIVESCPLCGTELSKVKFSEIQVKLKGQKQQELAEREKRVAEAETTVRHRLEQEFKKELQTEKENAAKLAKREVDQQIKKIAAERDDATKKAKQAEGREASIRKEAEKEKQAAAKVAKQQAEEQVRKIADELERANKKVKEAETRVADILKQAKEEAEKKREKELGDQRAALEKAGAMALLKQQSEFNRERESYQKKVKLMEHQLQKKTANELGDGGEIDVFENLREAFAFQGDLTTRIKKGQPGADIIHEVRHKGQACGRIIIDSKVHQGWKYEFVTKLRQDQAEAGAEQAILTTSAFPSGKKEMCIESDIIVVNPARIVHIVHILRQAMVTMHVRGLSMKERAGKMNKLYGLITSEPYRRKFSEAGKITQEILELDVQEKKAHDNVWRKRGAFATRINNVLREIETDVDGVIEGDDDVEGPEGYTVQTVKLAAVDAPVMRRS